MKREKKKKEMKWNEKMKNKIWMERNFEKQTKCLDFCMWLAMINSNDLGPYTWKPDKTKKMQTLSVSLPITTTVTICYRHIS